MLEDFLLSKGHGLFSFVMVEDFLLSKGRGLVWFIMVDDFLLSKGHGLFLFVVVEYFRILIGYILLSSSSTAGEFRPFRSHCVSSSSMGEYVRSAEFCPDDEDLRLPNDCDKLVHCCPPKGSPSLP